ncbi:MAG: NnrS family protein [Verrucomicrobiales bacterium]
MSSPAGSKPWLAEPYRVFFPMGVLAALIGVSLWPLFYAGIWPYPPAWQHPRLMIFGFGSAFVAGFLGTACPRFLEAPPLRRCEMAGLLGLWWIAQGCFLAYRLPWGDGLAGAYLALLLWVLLRRLGPGTSLPPTGFTLAAVSIAMTLLVALAWALGGIEGYPRLWVFTKLLAYQGLLLLPVLGIGSYLFARILHSPGAEMPKLSPGRRATGVWLGASLVVVSFGIEAMGGLRMGNLVRFAAVLLWVGLAVPALYRGRAPSTRAWALRMAVGGLGLSFLVRALWPGPLFAMEHLLFISGLGLILLIVADRVTLGHGVDDATMARCYGGRSVVWRWLVWLIVVAALTRMAADFTPRLMISHHSYAALLWVAALVLWSIPAMRLWWRRPGDS